MESNGTLYLAFLLLAFWGFFYIPVLLMRRSALRLIQTFCRQDALEIDKAKTVEELGLIHQDPGLGPTRPRDFKLLALNYLVKAGIIHVTEGQKLYMAEDRLDEGLRCSHFVDHDRIS